MKKKIDKKMKPCAECGMAVSPDEYHPYAACVLFSRGHNATVVRANLNAVVNHGIDLAIDAITRHRGGVAKPLLVAAIKKRRL